MNKSTNEKRTYSPPQLELVQLDNEISLALESVPPVGPGDETATLAPEYFNDNPFKTNRG
jgi:hypothetical protein